MKMIRVFLFLFLLTACGVSIEQPFVEQRAESIASDGEVIGVVCVSLKGCPVLIETTIAGEIFRFYPVNLGDEYKVDGLRITFNYSPSRVMQPKGCTLIDRVVVVENVLKSVKK